PPRDGPTPSLPDALPICVGRVGRPAARFGHRPCRGRSPDVPGRDIVGVGGVAPTYGLVTAFAGARWRRRGSLRSWRSTAAPVAGDRKSTRLNSSHAKISY